VAVLAGVLAAAGWTTPGQRVAATSLVPRASGPTWGTAFEVPGLPAAFAAITSVSCASAGNCSAGGTFRASSGRRQAFVISQVHGRWGKAITVPGSATLNRGFAAITSVSCGSAGNCSAGGYYAAITHGVRGHHAFVVSQVHGRWGKAIQVPGTPALNLDQNASISSMSCSSAGNCSAGGYYTDGSANRKVFVVSQVRGRWGKAIEVPGTAALHTARAAVIFSVSCGSAGNCSAGGDYSDNPDDPLPTEPFVVSQVNGRWRKAITVAASLGGSLVSSVSCASAGNCSAVGYDDESFRAAFVVSEVRGRWGKATGVPGLTAGDEASISSVSCGSAGNCSAGGSTGFGQVFVVSQVHGRWGNAIRIPPPQPSAEIVVASLDSISCASAGNCSAGGPYIGSGGQQVFVVSQVNGTWGTAIEVPGLAALNVRGSAEISSLSCGSPGNCSAGGIYDNVGRQNKQRAFIVSESQQNPG